MLAFFVIGLVMFTGLSSKTSFAQTTKTVTVNYVSTNGKTVHSPENFNTNGFNLTAYGNSFMPSGYAKKDLNTSKSGYVIKINGYLPYKIVSDYSYKDLPDSITVTYIKDSILDSRVSTQYFKKFNKYRAAQ